MSGAASEHEADQLLRIASLAEQFNSDPIASDARATAERIADGRFYVACVGQFKRGKSTLLNALMGKPILPSGIVPVTTVPTILRFGEHYRARVRLQRGKWADIAADQIEQYVSEKENPQNKKGVAGIEVFVPSTLLSRGLCFVDTPGRSEKYELRNFDPGTARDFALRTAQEMQLHAVNQEDVTAKIVRFSKGNPGAIRTMLQMAADPKYVVQQHVKLSPLYIDFRLQWGTDRG
jgi:Dynamin family